MDISESEEQIIREYVLSLTPEEIDKSIYLRDLDLETCLIEFIIQAALFLFFDVLNLRDKTKDDEEIKTDYLEKKQVLKKLRECQELDYAMLEMYLTLYMEKVKEKTLN